MTWVAEGERWIYQITLKTFRCSRGHPQHRHWNTIHRRCESLVPDRCQSHCFPGLEPDTPWLRVSPRDPESSDPSSPPLRNAFFLPFTALQHHHRFPSRVENFSLLEHLKKKLYPSLWMIWTVSIMRSSGHCQGEIQRKGGLLNTN